VADFDAAADFQFALAVRRRVAGDDVANVEKHRFRQVAAKIDAGHVIAGFVGAADKVAHGRHAAVGEDAYRVVIDTYRANEARFAVQALDDFLFGREAERVDRIDFAGLDLVQVMVAAQQQ